MRYVWYSIPLGRLLLISCLLTLKIYCFHRKLSLAWLSILDFMWTTKRLPIIVHHFLFMTSIFSWQPLPMFCVVWAFYRMEKVREWFCMKFIFLGIDPAWFASLWESYSSILVRQVYGKGHAFVTNWELLRCYACWLPEACYKMVVLKL